MRDLMRSGEVRTTRKKTRGTEEMKKTATIMILTLLALVALPAIAAEDGAALFKAKCQACHGPDGTKNVKANLSDATIQGKSDADLEKFITAHKAKNLTPEQVTALVSFIRTLKK